MVDDEKKIQTFGFTREDIKEIAKGEVIDYADDVIKKAIEDGEIKVLPNTTDASEGDVLKLDAQKNPVWGSVKTKLYLHNLLWDGAGGPSQIVNNSPEPLVDIPVHNVYFNASSINKIIGVSGAPCFLLGIYSNSGTTKMFYYLKSDGTIGSVNIANNVTITADTVTEL